MSSDVIIHADAIEAIEDHLRADPATGRGGLLIGMASQTGEIIVVTSAVLGEADNTLEELNERAHAERPGQRIVGWFRGHPGEGVLLTQDEVDIHSSTFARPWHLLYIVDATADERALFGWSDGDIVRLPAWQVTAAVQADGLDLPVAAPVVETEPVSAVLEEDEGEGSVSETGDVAGPADTPMDGDSLVENAALASGPIEPAPPVVPLTPSSEPGTSVSPKAVWIAVGIAVLIAIIIVIIVINSGDDDGGLTVPTDSSSATTDTTDTASSPSTDETPPSSAPQPPGTAGTTPPIPSAVATPASRVGPTAAPCEPSSDNTYQPLSDCFVPLGNGNIVYFTAGSLRCTEP